MRTRNEEEMEAMRREQEMMYPQSRDQRETGVRVVPTLPDFKDDEIRTGGRQFGKAQQAREEILENAHKNLALAQRHLVEGLEWLEVTGLLNTKLEEKSNNLKRLISDILEDVEGMRKVYVHPPQM